MPVEIPVYVDISAGINEAIKQIPKETQKLQKVVSANALKMSFDIGGGRSASLSNILTDPDMTKGQLKSALVSIRKEFERISQAAASKQQTKGAKELARAYAAVEQRLTGVASKTSASMLMTQDAITKTVFKIQQLQGSLSTMRRWTDEWNKTNYQIIVQKKRLQELQAQLRAFKMEANGLTGAFTRQHSVLAGLARQMSMYLSVYSLFRFVKQIRDVTGELEYQRVALGHLIQDEEYGNQLFGRILDLAKESPFRIKDLVRYTKELAAYRIEQEDLYDTTKRLADISAGLGVDMGRLVLAYGQVRAASVLRGQELRQFTEAGIPLVDELADKFSELNGKAVSTAEVFKKISDRAVPFSMIAEIFEDLTDKGGMFYEMQATQAKTLKGRWEKLKDAYDIALSSIGEDETFQRWNDTALAALNAVATNLKGLIRVINAAGVAWATYAIATSRTVKYATGLSAMFIREYGLVSALKMGVNGLTAAFKRLWVVMKTNWVGLALSAIAGLVTYLTTFRKKTDEAVDGMLNVQKSIESMAEANKNYAKETRLIDRFENLSKKTQRTARENEKLARTMDALRERFPELASKIGDENVEPEKQVELLRESSERRIEEERATAKQSLDIEKELNRLKKEQYDKAVQDEADAYQRLLEARESFAQGERNIVTGAGIGHVSEKQLQDELDAAGRAAAEAKKAREDAFDAWNKSNDEMARLQGLIAPEGVTENLQAWQKELLEVYKAEEKAGQTPVFTPEEIEKMTSVYDLFKKLKKRVKDLTGSIEGLRAAISGTTNPQNREDMEKELKDLEDTAKTAEEERKRFGFDFTERKSGGGGYVEDPFIRMMKDRISFMKDFRKGYDDLAKYIEKEDALAKEAEVMKTRGLAMGIDVEQQKRAATDLSGWYQQQIKDAFAAAKEKGARGANVTDFLSQQITDKGNTGKTLKAFQQLIQSLFDAKTDLDISAAKDNFERALKKLSDDFKRSKEGNDFFNNIFAATGDAQFAQSVTVGVYGDPGAEIGERIKTNMERTLEALGYSTVDGIGKEIMDAADKMDFRGIMAKIDEIPENLQNAVKEAAGIIESEDAELVKSFSSMIAKYGSAASKIAVIRAKAEKETSDIRKALAISLRDPNLSSEGKESLQKKAEEMIKALNAQADLDAFKASDDYVKFFSEINVMTAEQASLVRTKLRDAYLKAFHDGAISADELRRNLRAVDQQFKKLNESSSLLQSYLSSGFDGAIEKVQEYSDTIMTLASKMKSGKELDEGEQAFASRMLKMFGSGETKGIESYTELINKFQSNGGGLTKAGEAFGEMGEGMAAMAANGPGALAIVDAIIKAVNSTIEGIEQIINQLNEVRSEEKKIGEWYRYISDFNKYAFSGWNKLKSGDAIGAVFDTISSLISIYVNISKSITKRYDDQIKAQEKLINDLERSYRRLNDAIQDAFGSEYIAMYQQQLKALEAEVAAYTAQAEAERKKGKSGDEETAKGYEDSAYEAAQKIKDLRKEFDSFFLGSDITSAARSFATAWLDAYKSFGSTTAAMKEQFRDMIDSMVVNSLAAKIVEDALKPVFNEMNKWADTEGKISEEGIASIANVAAGQIDVINQSLNGVMAKLAGLGVNMRGTGSTLTGISKDIAGASEESILGLAAGINTQNYYMSYVPTISQNVAAIVALLGGGDVASQPGTTLPGTSTFGDELFRGQMSRIDENLAMLVDLVRSVRSVKQSSTNTHVIAVTN